MIDANSWIEASPDRLSTRAPAGMPSAVAVPRSTGDIGPTPASPVAPRRVDDPDVGPGCTAGQSVRPRRGPKTAAGKARVGLNALTHGIASARLVVPGESATEWELSRQGIVDALAPAGPVELALAERVATAFWRLRRVAAYEAAAIAERQHLATASARLLPHPLDIDKIIRFEAHLNRQLTALAPSVFLLGPSASASSPAAKTSWSYH